MSTLLVLGAPKTGKSEFVNQVLGVSVLATSELAAPCVNVVEPGPALEWLWGSEGRRLSEDEYHDLMARLPDARTAARLVMCRAPFPEDVAPRLIVEVPLGESLPELDGTLRVVILFHEYGVDRPTFQGLLPLLERLRRDAGCDEALITQMPSAVDASVSETRGHLASELARTSGVRLVNRLWTEAVAHARRA